MDETKLLNYLKGESDAEECLEVEAWYHASAEHKKQLDQLYYMLFVQFLYWWEFLLFL